jgi:hypothetical protein
MAVSYAYENCRVLKAKLCAMRGRDRSVRRVRNAGTGFMLNRALCGSREPEAEVPR